MDILTLLIDVQLPLVLPIRDHTLRNPSQFIGPYSSITKLKSYQHIR